MKLAVSGQVFAGSLTLDQTLETIRKYRVTSIEIWPGNISPLEGASVSPDAYEGRNIMEAKAVLDRHGFEVACVSMSAAFDYEIASDPAKYGAALEYAIEVAAMLGAERVNHYCYNLCLDPEPDMDGLKRIMKPAIRRAEAAGIMLCLENEAHDATRTAEGVLKIVEGMDSSHFKTNFDAANYVHAGQEGFPRAYNLLQEHIAYVHLKNGCIYDSNSGHDPRSKGGNMTGAFAPNDIYYPPLPDGSVNIDGLLQRLRRDGYQGYCTIEPHTKPELAEHYLEIETAYVRERGYFL
ncbi:hypothetical protein SY83_04960 [Paenibacillus swuensis]|uniref:Xylose isomerase-like TIM barrel domain-containing protein n=1 Tax=Paenibacillus swuensis TaxID=1178515 RepID=A0A172TFP1_9BACL|nr:sugar phosphate isomerase/epimerase family protein [Paenibacillus swuensis]ANE45756.1 hypothetical protein SY83_04960 [Paenibacillus swuensis]